MYFKVLKNLVTLFEKMGVEDDTPVKIKVEKPVNADNSSWEMSLNVASMKEGKPEEVEIIIREKISN